MSTINKNQKSNDVEFFSHFGPIFTLLPTLPTLTTQRIKTLKKWKKKQKTLETSSFYTSVP